MTAGEGIALFVATVGVFDGVHRGHQAVLGRARRDADRRGHEVAVITFDPHPRAVLNPDRAPRLIMAVEDREAALRDHGADHVIVLPFDGGMAAWTPRRFARETLVANRIAHVLVGADFRFGARAAAGVSDLRVLGGEFGFTVSSQALCHLDAQRVSSTAIRNLLARGDVVAAWRALGRPHRVAGRLGHDGGRAARLLEHVGELLPASGRYSGTATTDERQCVPAQITVEGDRVIVGCAPEPARRAGAPSLHQLSAGSRLSVTFERAGHTTRERAPSALPQRPGADRPLSPSTATRTAC